MTTAAEIKARLARLDELSPADQAAELAVLERLVQEESANRHRAADEAWQEAHEFAASADRIIDLMMRTGAATLGEAIERAQAGKFLTDPEEVQ